MQDKEITNPEETPFNFAMLFYIGLHKLIEEKDHAYISGDLNGWYRGLKAIKRKISFKVNKENKEKKEFLNKKFEEAQSILRSHVPSNESIQNQAIIIISDEAANVLEEIDEELTRIMDKYNMIFPKLKGSKGLIDITTKYKLDKPK